MKKPYTKAGKCGNTVWQRNRYGQICYPYHVPANPRTPAQQRVRNHFATVVARWGTLTEEQRRLWRTTAKRHRTQERLEQSGPMTGVLYFMSVNVPLVNEGKAPVDLPPDR